MYTVLHMDSVSEPAYLSQFLTLCGQPDLLDDASDLPSAMNLFSCAGGWEGGGGALVVELLVQRAVGHVSVVSDTIVY